MLAPPFIEHSHARADTASANDNGAPSLEGENEEQGASNLLSAPPAGTAFSLAKARRAQGPPATANDIDGEEGEGEEEEPILSEQEAIAENAKMKVELDIANDEFALGSYTKAKQLFDSVLKSRRCLKISDNEVTISARIGLAELNRALGFYSMAEKLYLKVFI